LNTRQSCLLLLIFLAGVAPKIRPSLLLNISGVEAFVLRPVTSRRWFKSISPTSTSDDDASLKRRIRRLPYDETLQLFSNRRNDNKNGDGEGDGDDDNDDNLLNINLDWISKRINRADIIIIRNDAFIITFYVLCRFLIYDITTGTKITPGFDIQDAIWLSGTLSSATVLVTYWTVAGLLSRSFQSSYSDRGDDNISTYQTLVNVALCCPIWLATEHLFHFGPSDIGGGTLSISIATGFIGLGFFMTLAKTLINIRRNDDEDYDDTNNGGRGQQ